MSYLTRSTAEMVDAIARAFNEEFREELERAVNERFITFKVEKLPKMLAKASSLVSAQLNQTPERMGYELSFVVRDMEELRKAIRE
jgi:hypothetical protein